MDFLLHAAYVTDVMGNLQLINRNLIPHLYIGDMTFMDTSEGIKNRPSRYGINLLLFKLNSILNLCPLTLQTLQNVLKNAPTDPLFLNESESALSRANNLFHIKHILQTWI